MVLKGGQILALKERTIKGRKQIKTAETKIVINIEKEAGDGDGEGKEALF